MPSYFDKQPECWSIHEYYKFRKQQRDFRGIFRNENSWLKKSLIIIKENSENKYSKKHIKRAEELLNNLKNQMSDPNVAFFWKEIDHERELKIAQVEGMKQAAKMTTDGVLNAIGMTNEIHQYNLRALLPAETVGQKSDEQNDEENDPGLGDSNSQHPYVHNKSPRTPEHQTYQKQYDHSEPFSSSEEGQSHEFLPSDISQNLDDLSDLIDSIESNDHDSDEDEFNVKDKILFKQRFDKFENSRKWKLKSGRYVEDVLYKLGMKCRYHNLVHSFIIDIEDIFVKDEFDEEEISEITEKENGQSLPEIDEEILEYINTFSKDSTKEIRNAINAPHPRLGDDYDPQKDFVFEHVKTTVADWVRLLEMRPNPLTLEMPEAWYRINVWRTIDIAFSDIPYTYVTGGEKAGLACTERKNRYRTLANVGPTQRKAVGRKGDAYVRTIGSTSTDWVASEAGSKWQGAYGTKLMKESGLSLPRTLKDIFIHLASKIQFEEQKMRKLNVIGFAHAGAVLIRVNLDCPAGYICRYMRRNPLEVYADVNNFSKSLDVLVEIIHAKLLVLQTMKVVNDPVDSNSNVTRWKQQTKLQSKRPLDTIPDVHPTPKKRKDKKRLNV